MSLRKLVKKLKGGPGSGFHGHSGRPGKRGGSNPQVVLGNVRSTPPFKKQDIIIDGNKVGYVQYKVAGNRLKINEIVVSKNERGKGIGASAVLALMKSTNTKTISKTVLTASGKKLFEHISRNYNIPIV